jgi:hypothetical protein
MAGHRASTSTPSGYGYEEGKNLPETHVTAGGVLSPVQGFRGTGITGTPPNPQHRGFPKHPGDGNIPAGGKRKAGGNAALQAFGLRGTGQNEK